MVLVLRRGACLSRQDLKNELKCLDYFLVGIINTVYNFKRNTTQFFLEGCPIESHFITWLKTIDSYVNTSIRSIVITNCWKGSTLKCLMRLGALLMMWSMSVLDVGLFLLGAVRTDVG